MSSSDWEVFHFFKFQRHYEILADLRIVGQSPVANWAHSYPGGIDGGQEFLWLNHTVVDVPYLSSTLRSQEIETPKQLVLALFGGKFNGYGDNYDGDVDVGKNF